MLRPHDIDCVIYHHPCMDGTASAMCAYRYFKNTEKKIEYYPASHGRSPPRLGGKNVLICDFSYSHETLLDMLKIVNKLLVIDHHKTAMEALSELPDQYKIFDMEHSGAYLTWKYFFPEEEVPKLIQLVEDRDLWKKDYLESDHLARYLFTQKYDFELYLSLLDANNLDSALAKGESYEELNEYYLKQLMNHATVKFMRIENKYYFVIHCECGLSMLRSDLGNKLLQKYPYADFSVTYHIKNQGITTFSLRSDDSHVDVSEVATLLHGGGHRNASGVAVNYMALYLPGVILDNGGLHSMMDLLYFDTYYEYNVVYLMSSLHKRALGKYLLQNRTAAVLSEKATSTEAVQNCMAICKVNGVPMHKRCDLAVIWNYHPLVDRSYYTISMDSELGLKTKSKIHRLFKADINTTKFWSTGMTSRFSHRSKINAF